MEMTTSSYLNKKTRLEKMHRALYQHQQQIKMLRDELLNIDEGEIVRKDELVDKIAWHRENIWRLENEIIDIETGKDV